MRTSLTLAVAALLFAASAAMAAQDKVDICHIPPGNPSAAHVISVGESAVPAHQAHGDFVAGGVSECLCSCLGQIVECRSACDGDPTCERACDPAFVECREECSGG